MCKSTAAYTVVRTRIYTAKSMGFVSSPSPYLSLANSSLVLVPTALTTGASYASADAGILDSTVSTCVIFQPWIEIYTYTYQ